MVTRYWLSPKFRLQMELEAYQKEYAYICSITPEREQRLHYLEALAEDLSSPLYGSLMSKVEAEDLISQRNAHNLQ